MMNDNKRIPAETFSVSEFIADELAARGWTWEDLATHMPHETPVDLAKNGLLALLVLSGDGDMDEVTACKLAHAFDVSPQFFINLDRAHKSGSSAAQATTPSPASTTSTPNTSLKACDNNLVSRLMAVGKEDI